MNDIETVDDAIDAARDLYPWTDYLAENAAVDIVVILCDHGVHPSEALRYAETWFHGLAKEFGGVK